MARTVAGTISDPFVLSLSDPFASGGSDTPLIIANTGMVTDGIRGSADAVWTIFNQGTVADTTGAGISLAGDGLLYNSGALSARGGDGVAIGGDGLIVNQGSISSDRDGVNVLGHGVINNQGSIFGIRAGVALGDGAVANWGSIRGSDGVGVMLAHGGSVANSGSITALGGGILALNGTTSVTNRGLIGGFNGFASGIQLADGSVNNLGTILGGKTGIRIDDGAVTNQGTISSYFKAITLGDGSVTNSGSILGGVEITGGSGTVINQGFISSGARNPGISVLFDSTSANNLLVIKPGAIFSGAAEATSGTNSTIELAKGSGAIGGVGSGQFDGFDTLKADAGASWTLNGSDTIGTVLNNGRLDIAGSLDVTTALDPNSTGIFQLDGPATLEIAAALGTSAKICFSAGSSLVIDSPALFGQGVGTTGYGGPLLEKFGGSSIDLKGFDITGANMNFSSASGLLQLTNAESQLATLKFQTSSLGAGMFHFTGDGSTGILITHS